MEASPRNPLEVRPGSHVASLLVGATYVGLYLLAALWGRDVATAVGTVPGVAPWFPAAGLSMALLVGFGLRWAPVVFLAELISGPLIFNIDATFTAPQVVLNAAAIAGAFTIGAWVLRDLVRIDTSLRDMRSLVWLLVVGVGAAPLLAALAGVGMRVWAGPDPASLYFDEVRTWWVGDAIGVASVTPAVLTVGSAFINRVRPSFGPPSEGLRDFGQTIVVLCAPFALYALQGAQHRLLLVSAFPVIWVAVTRGFLITSVTVLYTNAACTAAADLQGLGGLDLTDIQTFMLTLAVMSLGVAAATRELRRSRTALAYRATHDELTGLPNRGSFFRRLREAVEGWGDVSVIFFDIDRARAVGDAVGLEVMDGLLVQVAERVSRAVGPDCTLARYGGDEFAILICGPNAERRGAEVAGLLVSVLRIPFHEGEHELFAPASVGLATAVRPHDEAGNVLRRADMARAQARRRGGDTWIAYSEELGARVSEWHGVEHQLRGALERADMRVEYQPIFALPGREVVYVESLVRWRDAERGDVSPVAFIPVAEATGAIRHIGRFVLRAACMEAAKWPATQNGVAPIVTVNVSVRQLGDDRLIADIERALEQSGLPPSRLALEITESMGLEDPEATIAFLHRLRGLGPVLMIDDFGCGYSSLAHLHRLPVSVVKLDRVFASDLGQGNAGEAVVGSVVHLARGLSLKVVAEGVESDEQLRHLHRLGCDAVQGFGMSRPLAPEALQELLGRPSRPLSSVRATTS